MDTKMLGVRHLQVGMLFAANMICYASRNLNIALVAMTDKTNEQHFDIDLAVQGTLQSSVYWGYMLGVLPAIAAASRYGGRWFMMLCLLVNAGSLVAVPFSRFLGPNGWKMIYGCRIIQGMFQAFLSPSCLTLMSKWIPVEERSRLGGFTYSGIQLGNAFQLLASGYIMNYWGWPAIFYFYAILCVLWVVLYAFVGAETPVQSKIISEQEKIYIQTSLELKNTEKLKMLSSQFHKEEKKNMMVFRTILIDRRG